MAKQKIEDTIEEPSVLTDDQKEAEKIKQLEQYKKAAISGKTLVSGASYWDFELEHYFVGSWTGQYAKRNKQEKDKPENVGEDGKVVIGFLFESEIDGEQHIIGNSYAIVKALDLLSKDGNEKAKILIEFKGQTENAQGQPYNNFHIVQL